MTLVEKIINAYAITKIINPNITMEQVEELYAKYTTEGYEEYNKLHSQDKLAETEAMDLSKIMR